MRTLNKIASWEVGSQNPLLYPGLFENILQLTLDQGGRKSVPRVPPVPGSKRPQGEEVPKETKNNIVFSERYELWKE